VQAAVLSDGNASPVRASETFYLDAIYGTKDVTTPVFRIQERNLAFVTLEIKIVVHG